MRNKIYYIPVENNEILSSNLIWRYIKERKIIFVYKKSNDFKRLANTIDIDEPGIILKSSGSIHKSKYCIHPISNLNKSAESTGIWLNEQGLNLNDCFIFNTLPLNHISGFMPLWRSKVWKSKYINISPNLIKRTKDLIDLSIMLNNIHKRTLITSLVPTQLYRLLRDKDGLEWLKMFDVIWVGGGKLSDNLSEISQRKKIKLAPCYGATETAAMVSSLKPYEFLNGYKNNGRILKDIKLKINKEGIIEVKSERIGYELNSLSEVKNFTEKNGWWKSGDYGKLITINKHQYLKVIGRKDNAFESGGEIVFPDLIKSRINEFIYDKQIPIEDLIISKIEDQIWGNRFEIIIIFNNNINQKEISKYINLLDKLSKNWPNHERPKNWRITKDKSKFKSLIKNNWKNYI
ncbi:MAG: O-succinylbenzoic acid--CoA ligase [Prochlorococcus sp. SP3034]|nr:O-succinylbenzoic acid--CoA ligase [Prochlorococcus sp. SP3034]|tara:strand:- start:16017 stop:17231 length:1215 start_codon:yes stop_codon:yes gene_type:complete